MVLKCVVIAVIAYLLGSVNSSVIISKRMAAGDIRTANSGNAWDTNMARTYGKGLGILTFVCDVLKVLLAAGIAYIIIGKAEFQPNSYLYLSLAGLCCVLGHLYPCYFAFKGGKGVSACTGMVLVIDWRIALILLAVFAIVVLVFRYISLGSVVIASVYPVLTFFMFKSESLSLAETVWQNRWMAAGIALVFTVIVLVKHISNIKRIIEGTENKIG